MWLKKAYLICIVYMQNIREHTPVYVQTPRALTHFTILKVNCCVHFRGLDLARQNCVCSNISQVIEFQRALEMKSD